MNSTPLSDMMAQSYSKRDAKSYSNLLAAFRQAVVGVTYAGGEDRANGKVESTSQKPLSLAVSVIPDGRRMILTFADPVAFIERYGMRFNSEINGLDVFRVVEANRDCDGIQVNSAISEISLIIERETILSELGRKTATKDHWWKFWE